MASPAAALPGPDARTGWTIARGPAVLVVAIGISGFAAAALAQPLLWLVTPIVAAVVLAGGVSRVQGGSANDLDAASFPPRLRRALERAAAQLPVGAARELLASVVRQARAVFAADDERFSADAREELRRDVAELAEVCCTTALDLARLDAFLEPRSSRETGNAARRAELDARGRAARALFVRRLADAELALRAVYTAGVERGTPASDRVAELVTEIQGDAAARRAATDEIQRLLRVSD